MRIALTSGFSRKQIADELGVGMSTLNKWITAHRDTYVVSQEDRQLVLENERLRRENRILREERDIQGLNSSTSGKPATFWRKSSDGFCATAIVRLIPSSGGNHRIRSRCVLKKRKDAV